MKFSEAARGTRAEMPVDIPGTLTPSGNPLVTMARPLTQAEEEEVILAATKEAKAAGVENPARGLELYDAAIMVHTIVVGYMDPDSNPEKRERTFDGGAVQVRQMLGADEIAYLYERHEVHQNACSPSAQKATPEQLLEITKAMGVAKDDRIFIGLAPALRCSWALFTASLCVNLLEGKSPSGLASLAIRSKVKGQKRRRK